MEDGMAEFYALRKKLFDALEKSDFGYCKSAEGLFEINYVFHNFFDYYYDVAQRKDEPSRVYLKLYCYVIGPNRHYEWGGKTLKEAVRKADKEITQWIKDDLEDNDEWTD